MTKIQGQCYDGCSTMAGSKAGVAKKIEELEQYFFTAMVMH